MRGLHRLSNPDKLRMRAERLPGVSRRVLMSVGERERAQTFGQGPQDLPKLNERGDTAETARMLAWKQLFI